MEKTRKNLKIMFFTLAFLGKRAGCLEPPGPIVKSGGGGGFISTIGNVES